MEPVMHDCINVVIPRDAVEIKVTNMINPYFIRVYEVSDTHTKRNNLARVLRKVEKVQLTKKKSSSCYVPAVGDNVIVSNERINNEKIDLPDWICRGIVTDTTSKTSDVFLIDYGMVVNVPTDSLLKYSCSQVPLRPFTVTVGLYNIVPVDSQLRIKDTWSDAALAFIRQLFQVSKKTYFQVLANDSKGHKLFGDFFLVIEERNTCLSKILIRSLLAVPIGRELKQAVKSEIESEQVSISYQMGLPKEGSKVSPKKSDNKTVTEKAKNVKKKFMDKEKMLIQSELSCKPLNHISDARFTAVVHKALENNGVRTPKQIQSYMWPAFLQGLNVAAIGTHESGKTIGYLIPMISCLTEWEENKLEKPKDQIAAQPKVLILCATVASCVEVAEKCSKILYGYDLIKVSSAINGHTDKTVLTNICNKFNILVSTPPFLLKTLNKFSSKLNFSELSCLVLDETDLILEKYTEELITLIKLYKVIDPSRQNILSSGKMQIIAASETWTDKLCTFIEVFMEKPFICIGSFVEAAAYSNVKGRMMICHSDKKMDRLLNVLGDYTKNKTMVFCINSEEAIKLNNYLSSKSIKTLLVHEDMEILKIEEIRSDWNKCLSGMYPVIICTDQVVFELDVSNIDFLVHYTVTNISKTSFNRRFSVFMDNWLQESKSKCRVLILFDETKENIHFKGVVNILKRLKVELPSDWDEIANGLDLAADLRKTNYPICDSMKMFGWCKNKYCTFRHRVIPEVDKPTFDITIGDELKLIIMTTHNASHFTARLEETIRTCEETGRKSTTAHPFKIIQMHQQLKRHYANTHHKILEQDIVVGKICALLGVANYSRVQILNITEHDARTEKPKRVLVRGIDDGKLYEKINVLNLFELPEKLTERLPVIEVFLTNIAPFDEETRWTEEANKESQKWFSDHCSTTSAYASAKVLLQIGNCVFTDTIVARSKQYGYKSCIDYSNLKEVLLKNGHGEPNQDHLESLVNLCINSGLTEINGKPIKLPNNKISPIDECD